VGGRFTLTAPGPLSTPRLAGKDGSGRCPVCTRTIQLRQDGTLIRHKIGPERCIGSEESPAEPIALASWLPLRPA